MDRGNNKPEVDSAFEQIRIVCGKVLSNEMDYVDALEQVQNLVLALAATGGPVKVRR